MENQNVAKSVDLRGLCCAQPVILLSKEMKPLHSGDVLLAIADKVSMTKDIPAFCRQTGHRLLSAQEEDGLYRFWISKG